MPSNNALDQPPYRICHGACSLNRRARYLALVSLNVRLSGQSEYLMGWLVSAAILVAVASGSVQQPDDPILRPACKGVSVSLVAEASLVKAGDKPQFSVAVSNNTDRSVRILDVRDGRRPDLQDSYFELFVIQGTRVVDVPSVISDPGPLSAADFLELRPGARVEFRRVSYKRALEKLPPGAYEAFVLFWRDPMESHTTRCRSPSARFAVHE